MGTTIENRNESYYLTDKETRQKQVLDALLRLGSATNRELSETLRLPINCITGRVKELREKDRVCVDGKKFDSVTNRTVTLFKVKSKQLEMF